MNDRTDLSRIQGTAGVQGEHHRGARLLLFLDENGLFGDGQMDTCARNRSQGFHRAGQFALQGALVVDLFEELAGAEFLVLHQLEADRASLGQAFCGHLQAHFMDLVGRDHQRAAFGELVRDVLLLQGFDDGAAVPFRHVCVEHAVIRRLAPQEQPCQQRNGGGDRHDQPQFLLTGHAEQQPGQRGVRGICISHKFRVPSFKC